MTCGTVRNPGCIVAVCKSEECKEKHEAEVTRLGHAVNHKKKKSTFGKPAPKRKRGTSSSNRGSLLPIDANEEEEGEEEEDEEEE